MPQYQQLTVNIGGQLREEELNGRKHLVAPAAILPHDGIVPGNNGSVFYPKDENERSVPAWDHKPMVVNHPRNSRGKFVSACSPYVLNTRGVGLILNTNSDDKLRTECWFDIEKTNSVDERIIKRLRKGEMVECSTGVFTENEEVEGQDYKWIAHNYKPDHLAILPDKLGAYSVKQGGGILQVNEEPERTREILRRGVEQAFKPLGVTFNENELSFSAIQCQLADLLANKLGEPGKYWGGYIQAVYPSTVVYCVGMGDMFKLNYTVNKDDEVILDGDPIQVERVVEYRTTDGETYSANESGGLTKKEIVFMPAKFDKKGHVTQLISNGFEETDRVWLEKLDDAQLEKIQPKQEVTTNEEPEPEPEKFYKKNEKGKFVEVETPQPRKGSLTLNEVYELVGPQIATTLKRGIKADEDARTKLISTITANVNNRFKPEFLAKKDMEELEAIAALAVNSDPDDDDEDERFLPNYRGNRNIDPEMNANEYSHLVPLDIEDDELVEAE